jgi:predicted DNA-binding transcriptional regulator AlpA
MTQIMPVQIYGLTEFAAEVGTTKSTLNAKFIRGKLPEPAFLAGNRPFWTKEQVDEYVNKTACLKCDLLEGCGGMDNPATLCSKLKPGAN